MRFVPVSKAQLSGFVRAGTFFAQSSPTGDPYDTFHTIYNDTLLTRKIPPQEPAVPPVPVFSATGGTVSTIGGTRLHTFTSLTPSPFIITNPSPAKTITMFLVGGGGGSGSWVGGGGGGGRVVILDYVMPSNTYMVTVGAGGVRSSYNFPGPAPRGIAAGNGGPSSVGTIVTVPGGGGAGSYDINAGLNGGSGGGGSQISPWHLPGVATVESFTAGTLVASYGSGGGTGTPSNGNAPGAGGGGATAVGGSITVTPASCQGGPGGAGVQYALTGLYYGGGGGGSNGNPLIWGGANTVPQGGIGGGGNGAINYAPAAINVSGSDGAPSTGGGAGGSYAGDGASVVFGATGGTGIVIISYPFP
jgi:hypothetical protein